MDDDHHSLYHYPRTPEDNNNKANNSKEMKLMKNSRVDREIEWWK
jgi:hypothetical protein